MVSGYLGNGHLGTDNWAQRTFGHREDNWAPKLLSSKSCIKQIIKNMYSSLLSFTRLGKYISSHFCAEYLFLFYSLPHKIWQKLRNPRHPRQSLVPDDVLRMREFLLPPLPLAQRDERFS